MFKTSPLKSFLLFLVFVFLINTGAVCKGSQEVAQMQFKNITLNFWGVFDEEEYYKDIIANYRLIHPNISVNYRKFRYDEYEAELLDALAEDRGPDIFLVHNTWMKKYLSKFVACPDKLTLAYKIVQGSIKKETFIEYRSTSGITQNDIINNFVDQVVVDSIWDTGTGGKVYGVPFALDNLVLFYNKDILNNSGIPEPARTWSEFQDHVKNIVRLDSEGEIILAGGSIGTSNNVERSSDILSLLMMQNGTVMREENEIMFNKKPTELKERVFPPALEALRFYTDFANYSKEVYTWNENMPSSLDTFVAGKSGYFFGYAYHLPIIKAKAPKLHFSVAKVPQIAGNKEVNFANYFLSGVSTKSENQVAAWDFLKYATMNKEVVKTYLDNSHKPTALRGLIKEQSEDLEMAPFVLQVLTAKSWYNGYNALAMESIMEDLIDMTLKGDVKITEAIKDTVTKVQQTMKK